MILLDDKKIASVYLGDSKIAKVYRGDDLVYEDAPWKKQYQRLESVGITYTGPNMTNYVDTGIIPKVGQTIKMKINHHGYITDRRWFFWGIYDIKALNGSAAITNSSLYKSYSLCSYWQNTYNYRFAKERLFGANSSVSDFNMIVDSILDIEININSSSRSINVVNTNTNTILINAQQDVAFYASPYTYYLMLSNFSGTNKAYDLSNTDYYCRSAIASYYDYEVYENGVLVQHLVPCYDITVTTNAGKYGFFDLVSKTFFPVLGSIGNTTIRVGTEIPW